jgi:hypothetical protein
VILTSDLRAQQLSGLGRLLGCRLLRPPGCRNTPTDWGRDFDISSFDIFLELIESGAFGNSFPGRQTAVEDFVHFFEGLAFGLGSGEEHVDKGTAIEGCEDHIHLPITSTS